MRRRIFLLSGLAALSLSGALLGCGGGGDSTDDPTPTPSPTPTPTPGGAVEARGKLIFSEYEGGIYHLVAANADGSGKVSLTGDANANEQEGHLSPDGKKLAFLSTPKNFSTNQTVKIVNLDGSGSLALTSGETLKVGPRFSPDGSKIVFQGRLSKSSSSWGIFTVNADGSGLTQVSKNTKKDYENPDFSPDATKIAFAMDDEIYVMNADGTNEVKLTSGGEFNYLFPKSAPRYSPDGTKLLYTVYDTNSGSGTPVYAAYVMNANGTGATKLTNARGFDWSPDGAKVLLKRYSGSGNKLLVVNGDGTGETLLSFSSDDVSW